MTQPMPAALTARSALMAGTTILTALPRKDEQKEVRMMTRVIVRRFFSLVVTGSLLMVKV